MKGRQIALALSLLLSLRLRHAPCGEVAASTCVFPTLQLSSLSWCCIDNDVTTALLSSCPADMTTDCRYGPRCWRARGFGHTHWFISLPWISYVHLSVLIFVGGLFVFAPASLRICQRERPRFFIWLFRSPAYKRERAPAGYAGYATGATWWRSRLLLPRTSRLIGQSRWDWYFKSALERNASTLYDGKNILFSLKCIYAGERLKEDN